MSRELPILFNTDMVRAILREPPNNKTATRRAIKGYIPDDAVFGYTASTPEGYISCRGTFEEGYGEKFFKLPCQKGDTLYVRETWCWEPCWDCGMDTEENNCCNESAHKIYNNDKREYGCYGYRADYEDDVYPSADSWHPSIHMPKEAARIWLKVTDVRVEHLQDMETEDDRNYIAEGATDKHDFIRIWDSVAKDKECDWYANPWVYVIEFERCDKPEH